MAKYITQVKFSLWNGFVKNIEFRSGLNIISGTNGTGKTKLLQFIQQNNGNAPTLFISDGSSETTFAAFSPLRSCLENRLRGVA